MNGNACDIVIAGGGMVGASLALALARATPWRIAVVEAAPIDPARLSYQPSFDARSTALAQGSRDIFEAMGVWPAIAGHAAAIAHIHISERGRLGRCWLHADRHGLPALGYVVENQALGIALWQALEREPAIQLVAPGRVVQARRTGTGMALTLARGEQQETLTAGLLMIADGARSGLCQQLGIDFHEKPYGQTALIANLAFATPHGGVAYERFTREGPLALLPLSDHAGEHRMALVWTHATGREQAWQEAGEAQVIARLQALCGARIGRIVRVGQRASYPLALVQSREQVRAGLAVVGNAAHALHPVAGQGFNLALRDVAALAAHLRRAAAEGLPPGHLPTLRAYEASQRADQQTIIGFSDLLPSLFGLGGALPGAARGMGLQALDGLPALKQPLVEGAAGLRWQAFTG